MCSIDVNCLETLSRIRKKLPVNDFKSDSNNKRLTNSDSDDVLKSIPSD